MNGPNIVAAVQYAPKLLDVRKNLGTALQLTFEAAAKGARVVVLPELCLSGFAMDNVQEASSCAQTRDGYQTQAFLPIAQRFNCHVVFGYVELLEGDLYNSAAVVGPSGLERSFQKHNLYGRDAMWAKASEQVPGIVLTNAGRLGVLICRDVVNNYRESYSSFNPKHRFYRRGDVDSIALVTAWGDGYAYPDHSWIELVESIDCNLIVSNRVGLERDMRFKGGSAIIDRAKRVWTNGSNFDSSAVVGGIVRL